MNLENFISEELITDNPYEAFKYIFKKMMFYNVNEVTGREVRDFYFSSPRSNDWHIHETGEVIKNKEEFIDSFKVYNVKLQTFIYDNQKSVCLDKKFLVGNYILKLGMNVEDRILAFNFEKISQ